MLGTLTGNVSELLARIADIDGNRLLDTSGRWYGFYKLDSVSYDMQPEAKKLDLHRDYVNALSSLTGRRFKILSFAKDFDWAGYVERSKNISPQASRMQSWLEWNDYVADRVGNRSPFEREVFLSVPLEEPSFAGGFLDDVARFAELATERLTGLLGGDDDRDDVKSSTGLEDATGIPRHIRKAPRSGAHLAYTPLDRKEAIERSEAVAQIFASLLAPDSQQPKEADIARIVHRMTTYGLGEPAALGAIGPGDDRGWKPRVIRPVEDLTAPDDEDTTPFEPDFEELRELMGNCTWEADLDRLVFYWGGGRISYGRFLRIKSMPEEGLQFPDHEFGMLPFQANMVLDGDVIESHRAERERKNDAMRLEEQLKHIHESGARVPLKLRAAERVHNRIEAQLASNKPMIKLHATIWVFASSPEQLEVRTRTVSDYFKDNFSIRTVVPRGNQIEAFADFLPAGDRALSGYVQQMPPETAAGSMACGDNSVGDGGPYLGYTRRTRAVVGRAAERPMSDKATGSMSGTTVWIGEPGAGKSVGCYYDVCRDGMRGVPALILDSKGDAQNIKNIPELRGAVEEYQVAANSSTRLPLMRVYPLEEAGETLSLLTSFLVDVLNARGADSMALYHAITWASDHHVTAFVDSGGQRKMSGLRDSFLECSRQFEDDRLTSAAKFAADYVDRLLRPTSLASLCLADDAEYGDLLYQTVGDGLITVILTHGLRLPKYDQADKDITDTERIAEAIQSVVAASAWRMASTDRMRGRGKDFKRLVFEEAWRTLQNSHGKALIDSVDRESRSLRLVCDILTQKGSDLGATLELANVKFIGRNTDQKDAAMLLKDVGVDPDPELLEFVGRQKNGQFIHQDYMRRTSPIQVDVVPDHWLPILDTTPEDRPDAGPDTPDGSKEGALAGAPA